MTTQHTGFIHNGAAVMLAAASGSESVHRVLAQPAIPWQTVDSGGGQCAAGVFTLHGSIGQADAGVMSGGPFALVGGFWRTSAPVAGTNQRLYMPLIAVRPHRRARQGAAIIPDPGQTLAAHHHSGVAAERA